MKKLAAIFIQIALFSLPSSANSSQYFVGEEELANAQFQLIPWESYLKEKLCRQSGFKRLESKMVSCLEQNQLIICWLHVKDNGMFSVETNYQTSGPRELSGELAKFVCESGPFKRPPNMLPMRAWMEVSYFRAGKTGVLSVKTSDRGLNFERNKLITNGADSIEEFLWSAKQRRMLNESRSKLRL